MQTSHDTEPRNPLRGQNINNFPDQPTGKIMYADHDDDDMGGPGCVVWGIVGMFSVLLAGVLVMVSAFAGWNSGLSTARVNATATVSADIQVQCDQLQTSIEDSNTGLLQRRIEFLELQTPAPECLTLVIPTATALYLQLLPTDTPTPTETPTPTDMPTEQATEIVEATSAVVEVTEDGSSSLFDYDLDALLSEAEAQLSTQNYQDAVDTLDAIIAIDENYQRTQVRTLYFNALTSEANRLFRAGKLAEGIILTNRAEAFGDIQGLNYERFIAQLYLSAQRLKSTNPGESVRLFSRIAYEQGLTNYLNGQVMTELQESMVNYADRLSAQGDYCAARDQYSAALQLQPIVTNISRGDVTGKQTSAGQACTSGVAPAGTGTPIEVQSSDGTIITVEPPIATAPPTIAPVGQQ